MNRSRRRLDSWISVVVGAISIFAASLAPNSSGAPIREIREAFRISVAAVGVPGATRGFLVQPNAIFNGEWRITVIPEPGLPESIQQALPVYGDPEGIPIANWRERVGGIDWHTSVVATKVPTRGDSIIVASIEVRARNTGQSPEDVSLTFRLEPAATERAFTAFNPAADDDTLADDLVNGWCGAVTSGPDAVFRQKLAPGKTAAFRILMPSVSAPRQLLQSVAGTPHTEYVRRCSAHWERLWQAGMSISLGDDEVEQACRQALTVLLGGWEKRGLDLLPIGGPFHYRDVYVRDGARATVSLALWSQTHLARELAQGLMTYQWSQGFIMSQRGQPDGTGQALWALEQSHLRGAKQAVPADVQNGAVRAWRWLERQRLFAGQGVTGLQPFATPNDNEGVRAQLVGTDFWAIAGYRAAARLSRHNGAHALADSIDATREDHVQVVEERLSSFHDIPPSWQSCGYDWGNLTAVYPCGVLRPEDDRMTRLAGRLWSKVGGAGLCAYGSPDSLHYYYGADLATWALLAGRSQSADSVLNAMLYWRTASGGAPELFSRSNRDFGTNYPPHSTGVAAMLALVRNMLVYDDDDTLRLTLAARGQWWKHGARVRRAATAWGPIDVKFALKGGFAEWHWTPVPAWTKLTLPPETETSLEGASPGVRVIECPPGTSRARVRVRPIT
jgi:hypothetical protein